MATISINFNTDSTLKNQAQAIFDDLGLDMATAFNLFLKQVVYKEAIPFEISRPKPVDTLMSTNDDLDLDTARKREMLRQLRGSCKDPTMVEPPEVPFEYDLPRRYDLI
ncbi:MAG: type II toxin-antitoxin system RelB/DinJ family antitoxin [Defluviitaleaceae bacterium]|nr:type II toxin-antitoxin system RelB/DinJ family antitoxin [Defluviitaleaceae bacterium]